MCVRAAAASTKKKQNSCLKFSSKGPRLVSLRGTGLALQREVADPSRIVQSNNFAVSAFISVLNFVFNELKSVTWPSGTARR